MTEEAAWVDWMLYILDAVEQTSLRTHRQITEILAQMESVRERAQREAPGVYSKDLIAQIFRQPYCKIQFLERAGIGTRQTCSKYLRELERLGWSIHGSRSRNESGRECIQHVRQTQGRGFESLRQKFEKIRSSRSARSLQTPLHG